MAQDFNLFDAEDQLAEECRALLDAGGLSDACAAALAKMLAGYERLLRETKQLIRLSDRREHDLNRLNKKLEQLTHSLAYQAEHDFLTGCLNKGAMTARLSEALATRDCGLIILDIDHFKHVNDQHGHPAGDAVLRGLAEIMQEMLGSDDHLGRIGGEEFAILLQQPTLIQAKAFAERLRRAVEASAIDAGAQPLRITVSLGVTPCRQGEPFAAAYGRADEALYAAKTSGRNRVESRE